MRFSRFVDPDIDRHLLADQGEYVIDEVEKHWITVVVPVLTLVCCIPLFVSMPWWGAWWPVPCLVGLAGLLLSLVRMHVEHMERFVITNMRVFRVHGVLNQHMATTPLNRILDITVLQPFWGQLLNYGHFVFESAAQDQGLRDITYVPRPEQRDLTIQHIIQSAGLRPDLPRAVFDDDDPDDDEGDGT